MIARIARIAVAVAALLMPCASYAQDVPGIEICTVEKTMERRTSCLQSNVDFLQKTINKMTQDNQQKLDAANRQIEALKGSVIALAEVRGRSAEEDGGRIEEEGRCAGEGCGAAAAK